MSKHSLEFNKVAGGILLAGVIAMITGFVADGLYNPKTPEKRGFSIEVAEASATDGKAAPVAEIDIGTLLAAADVAKGDVSSHKKCVSCHTFGAGEPDKVGPNLNGIVGKKIAGKAGYAYSAALTGHGGNWDYDALNKWLKAPASFAKGNKMAFAGVKNDAERADIIMYLKSISPSAPALPAPQAAPAAAK